MTTNNNITTSEHILQAAKGYHSDNTTQNYLKGRTTLPKEAIDYIKNTLKVDTNALVVDLAAGTGKFTELLCGYGGYNNVIAIEPSPNFREACNNTLSKIKETRADFQFKVIDGVSTHIPLADESVDMMVVAQAFHWFDNEESLREMTRVLKKDAPLVLVWIDMDVENDFINQTQKIFHVKYYDGVTPQFRSYKWREVFQKESVKQFINTDLPLFRMKFNQDANTDILLNRALSISYISLLSNEKKEQLVKELKEIIEVHPHTAGKESFTIPYFAEVYYTFKK